MSESSDRRILGWTLSALVAVSALIAVIIVLNLNYIHQAVAWRSHTFDVLETARNVRLAMSAEDRARPLQGPRGEAARRAARLETDARFDQLLGMTRDNAVQQTRLRTLRAQIAAARARGAPAPVRVYDEFRAEEIRLMAQRGAVLERAFRISYVVLVGGALIGAAASMLILWRGASVLLRAKRDAEKAAELTVQLMQVGRLNTLGEMAGTLSHELNQPLGAASTYVNAARRMLGSRPEAEQVAPVLQKAADQMKRAGEIIRRMRDFLERGESHRQPENLAAMVEEASALMQVEARRHDATIRVAIDATASWVMADRVQIHQVLVNLMRNAMEAMAGQPRRELDVRIDTEDEGALVRVSVSDTGPGLSPEVIDRLFQAFVTSKAGGMGVGLSMCRNIVEAHGGRIWTDVAPGGGAVFHFTLPRREAMAGAGHANAA